VDEPSTSATPEPEIVSKSEFARLTHVVPGRVTQWISEKKIYGDALVGEGRSARIRAAVARGQLRRHIDIGQRHGNGLGTRLDDPPPAAAPVEAPPGAQVIPFQRPAPASDPIEERIKQGRLEGIERDNRRKAEEEAERRGLYTRTDDVRKQFGRVTSQNVDAVEGWLGEAAAKIAAAFNLSQRDVLHLLRNEFRAFRATSSTMLRQQAGELAEFVDGDVEESATDELVDQDDGTPD
jgi:hypothetical protein